MVSGNETRRLLLLPVFQGSSRGGRLDFHTKIAGWRPVALNISIGSDECQPGQRITTVVNHYPGIPDGCRVEGVVTDVSPNSPAAERGLKPGDVIVEVQQGEVTTPADVQQKVDSVKKESRKSVLMLIQRQDGLQWVPLSLGSDKDKQPG